MPNHVDNALTITCEDDKIMERIRTMIFDNTDNNSRIFTMSKILPIPKEFSGHEGNTEIGYYWRLAMWGTKWDVYNYRVNDFENKISISYQTAWSPNLPWIESLCNCIQNSLNYLAEKHLYISVKLTYTEFNCDFGGIFNWVPFKKPFNKCYTLLEYARRYDMQLYTSLSEFYASQIPEEYTGHYPTEIENDSTQQIEEEIDLGDLDCLTEDDLYKETWLVAGMDFPNHIDYFWEAEITVLCQTKRGDFFTISRDSLSEPEYDNYSKYLCYVNDSGGFVYCNKESCEGCTNSCTEKVLNEQYVLWEKYVQPIE